ncbi:MAG: DUF3795 domain-containing protein [Tenuifilaceae bacterium]
MDRLISCCGLDCGACNARKATLANDDELRAQTAEKWRTQHNSLDISPEMINCTGCREPGIKFGYCDSCEIRNCVKSKNYQTCADCSEMESCTILGNLVQCVPTALENLKSLR